MRSVILACSALAVVVPAAAGAQSNSYQSDRPAPKKGDPKKIVCESEEQIGSRLGKRKTCMTVEQWNEKHKEHREFAEDIQSGTWAPESGVQLPDDHRLKGQGPQ